MASKKEAKTTKTGKRDRHQNEVARTKKAVKENSIELTDPTKTGLKPQEEKFCQVYISPTEFYGNGTQSYIEAFDVQIVTAPNAKIDVDGNKVKEKGLKLTIGAVRDRAYKLLLRSDILERINELLEEGGLNDAFVDKQLKHLIIQSADPRVKLGAIAEYNKLMARIVKQEAHMHGFSTEDMTEEEIKAVIKKQMDFFNKK